MRITKIVCIMVLCCIFLFSSKGEAMAKKPNSYYKEQLAKINYTDGINKKEAIIIAQNELLKSQYKNNYNIKKPIVNYDKEFDTWSIAFEPKNNFDDTVYWGVLIKKTTGQICSGSMRDL